VADDGGVLYLVVSGAPAPEGIPALVAACQAAGWRVVVFSTPNATRFIDPAELEKLTGAPVRSEYRMPGRAVIAGQGTDRDDRRDLPARLASGVDEYGCGALRRRLDTPRGTPRRLASRSQVAGNRQ
jgi:hypothetical protein